VVYSDQAPFGADGTGSAFQRKNENVTGNYPVDWEVGLFPTPGLPRATYDAWRYHARITFGGYNRSEALTNFPALVVLGTNITGFGYTQFCSTAGWDLRLTDADGTNQLFFEVEEWNTNGSSYMWVLVPQMTGGTDSIWAYWGNSRAGKSPYWVTNGLVWPGIYDLVMHMAETNGAAVPDATANRRYGQIVGGYAWEPGGGRIGGALRLTNSTYDRVTLSQPVSLGDEWTIEAWYKEQVAGTTRSLCSGDSGDRQVEMHTKAAQGLGTFKGASADFYTSGCTNASASNQWRHVGAVGSSTTTQFYVDGVYRGTSYYKSTNLVRYVGNYTNGQRFAQYLDEVRISHVARSTNWLWASWLNHASNMVFASYNVIPPAGPDPDQDGDKMPDAWEIQYFGDTNALNGGPLEDRDNDGLLNAWEYTAGTDPTNDKSVFELEIVNSNGVPTVRFYGRKADGTGYEGKSRFYDLEDRTNLSQGTWSGMTGLTNVPGTNGPVTGTNPPSYLNRFYRARAWLQ